MLALAGAFGLAMVAERPALAELCRATQGRARHRDHRGLGERDGKFDRHRPARPARGRSASDGEPGGDQSGHGRQPLGALSRRCSRNSWRSGCSASLEPPPSVMLDVEGDRTVAQGQAPAEWLDRAQDCGAALPAGAPRFDISGRAGRRRSGHAALGRLHRPASRRTRHRHHRDRPARRQVFHRRPARSAGGRSGAVAAARPVSIRPRSRARWTPYQSLDAAIRPETAAGLARSAGERGARRSKAAASWRQGSASSHWLERARIAARLLPPGAPAFDLFRRDAMSTRTDTRLWNKYLTPASRRTAASS